MAIYRHLQLAPAFWEILFKFTFSISLKKLLSRHKLQDLVIGRRDLKDIKADVIFCFQRQLMMKRRTTITNDVTFQQICANLLNKKCSLLTTLKSVDIYTRRASQIFCLSNLSSETKECYLISVDEWIPKRTKKLMILVTTYLIWWWSLQSHDDWCYMLFS